jgi:proline iminopeptidase
MRKRFLPLEPYRTGYFAVSKLHELYFEESGNPNGLPVLFLHGGPGSGTEPSHRTFFDPTFYRIILFDQRGSGLSRPHSCLEENTTWDLVSDIELLRQKLHIEQWVVFGGSWGSTLALTYAITHPKRVLSLLVRGIFLGRKKEIRWFYQQGAHLLFPDMWEKFLEPIPEKERGDLVAAYYKRFLSDDSEVRRQATKAWAGWEGACLRLQFDPALYDSFTEEDRADAIARIECHYFSHNCFFSSENWILENAQALREIPGVIVHGRYDVVCPLENAWELHKVWPVPLKIIPDAGHSASEPGIQDALMEALEEIQKAHSKFR